MTPLPLAGPRDWGGIEGASPFENAARRSVRMGGDLERIYALPRRAATDEGTARAASLVDLMTERLARPRKGRCDCASMGRKCITRLKTKQAESLFEAPIAGGLLGPIGVGHGKTGLDILMPLVMPGCQLAVLLVPPQLRTQLMGDYLAWREHFHVPSIRIGDMGGHIVPGAPSLHVIPYTIFSRPESTDLLERLNPDLIIADEVHKLRHKDTARTGRLLRYFAAHPDTRFCGWSGTILAKSIKDKAHLAALALRYGSPLPLNPGTVDEWANAIDPSDWPAPPGALKIFIQGTESLHSAVHRRIVETRGVVATRESAIGASIILRDRKPPIIPPEIVRRLRELRTTWLRPDGEELVDGLEVNRCAKELASGFFYRWRFPRGEDPRLIEDWYRKRKAWRRELREKLKDRVPHLDSPGLCENAAIRAYAPAPYKGDLPLWHALNWPAWAEISESVKPEPETIWIDEYLARDAVAWAKENRGIIWYEHSAFGKKVSELGGLPLHGGGPLAESRILAETGKRSIVVSIKSHGTGRDGLQRLFDTQLIANPPAGGDAWEQLLGRLHREGFEGNEVTTDVYRHTQEYADAIDRALQQARFVEGVMGSHQKLLAATCDFETGTGDYDLP